MDTSIDGITCDGCARHLPDDTPPVHLPWDQQARHFCGVRCFEEWVLDLRARRRRLTDYEE